MGMSSAATSTPRSRAKADRRAALLHAAAGLFAERGFNGVSIEDLGAAAGVSGPALYRHFASKQAMLAALLVDVSEHLLSTGERLRDEAPTPADALTALIAFHVDFALGDPDVIRVQDRDLDALPEADRRRVRTLQRRYVDLWSQVLSQMQPELAASEVRIRVQACFGLINSTPHSTRVGGLVVARETTRPILEAMARTCLTC